MLVHLLASLSYSTARNILKFLIPQVIFRKIILADQDGDDCLLFKGALDGFYLSTHLTTVHNGEQLMELLLNSNELPDILFLDLNMSRKTELNA